MEALLEDPNVLVVFKEQRVNDFLQEVLEYLSTVLIELLDVGGDLGRLLRGLALKFLIYELVKGVDAVGRVSLDVEGGISEPADEQLDQVLC